MSRPAAPRSARRISPFLTAYVTYQALALAAWWHLLAGGLSATLPAGSADPAEEAWFLAWVPHALGTGQNPFFSHAIFAPEGVNMLANTSFELLGLLFSPITVLADPVASLDVATLLAPALSALGAFALCRRYVRWQPAAWVGGLVYGFGPFLATDLRYGHLDLTWLVVPPLVFLTLDELLVRRRRSAPKLGALLGALVVVQFFVSTEMLAITVITAAIAVVLGAAVRPGEAMATARRAATGLGVAVLVAAVALSYPVWVVVAGPRHVTGPVWAHVGDIASTLAAAVQPHAEVAGVAFISGGNGSYLGVALLVLLVAGACWCWRSRAMRWAIALVVACYVVSLGYDLHARTGDLHVPLPAAVLGHLPLLDSLVPERFASMVDLFAGVAVALVVERMQRSWTRPRAGSAGAARRRWSVGAAGIVLLGAIVSLGLLPPWPYATTTLHRPAVLQANAGGTARSGVPVRGIAVVYPDSSTPLSDEMVWQAEDGYAFSLADGYAIVPGAGGRAVEGPRVDALWLVLAAASLRRLHLPLTATTRRSVRTSLRALGAREVVVLPGARGSSAARAALTSVLGVPSAHVRGATVWQLRGH